MVFSSALLENAVNSFAKLPGIGRKTALRLVLHLIKQPANEVEHFTEAIATLRKEIKNCKQCQNISDTEICNICSNPSRKKEWICVVENIRDVIAIESTQQFNGTYHVLGGIISPLDGIGPDQLHIESLVERVKNNEISEIIFALNPNIQGDTTIYYIGRKLKDLPVKITTIARGISFGGELEYADEMTLAKSISNRIPVEHYVQSLNS
jgi:recombination protein RecR